MDPAEPPRANVIPASAKALAFSVTMRMASASAARPPRDSFSKRRPDSFDASVRYFGEWSKGYQAIGATVVDYSKKAFEDSTRAFEQLMGAKTLEQAWEIQSQYAKKAFDAYVAQASKIGEMYVDLARNSYRTVGDTTKTARR